MLLIYPDVMDAIYCDILIKEHESNPLKHVTIEADKSFDGRVLLLQNMTDTARSMAATIAVDAATVLGRHFRVPLYAETVSVVRWDVGQEMALHRDGQTEHTKNRTHAAVIYLNEQDSGGAIYFPEMGTEIAPRRAVLVAFDNTVLHGVRQVCQPRYTLTLWFTTRSDMSIIRFP